MKTLIVKKPWGEFEEFTHNSHSTVKIIRVLPGEELSLQTHKKRSEFWRVIEGSGVVTIEENKHNAKVGDEFEIGVGMKHRLSGGSGGIAVLEIALGDFDEEDILRLQDKYGRV